MASIDYWAVVPNRKTLEVRLSLTDGTYGPVVMRQPYTKRGYDAAMDDCGQRNRKIADERAQI